MNQHDDKLIATARTFADDDPDDGTRKALLELIGQAAAGRGDSDAHKTLQEMFGAPLTFGTAGLRGLMGPGPSRMNRYVVERTTAGLCAHLLQCVSDARSRGVCIGFDARHQSADFAQFAAAIARGFGFTVHLFDAVGPTPLLAYAVRQHRAAAGIMITASHNPAEYNGYKVYNSDGTQLAAPDDEAVARHIAAVRSVRQLPRIRAAEPAPTGGPGRQGVAIGRKTRASYLRAISAQVPAIVAGAPLTVAYTPLHGVGAGLFREAIASYSDISIHVVDEQLKPDPDFPSTPFPNPEEAGAMDAVLDLGVNVGADLALANDPDADRLAVAAIDEDDALRILHGNEVGVLLMDFLLGKIGHDDERALVCFSLVSSPVAARTAQAYGATARKTLTGFKWICGTATRMAGEGYRPVLGFEEALGYAVGDSVRDKDGIGAALVVAAMASEYKAQGKTLFNRLDEICKRDGCFVSSQMAITREGSLGARAIADAVSALRASPPQQLDRRSVEIWEDFKTQTHRQADGVVTATDLPPSNVIVLHLAGGYRVCVRPSGTEPKLKLYFDAVIAVPTGTPVGVVRAQARTSLNRIQDELVARLGLNDRQPDCGG